MFNIQTPIAIAIAVRYGETDTARPAQTRYVRIAGGRADKLALLDTAYLHLYGIDRDDAEYLLSTFKGIHDPSPLTAGKLSVADNVLRVFDELSV